MKAVKPQISVWQLAKKTLHMILIAHQCSKTMKKSLNQLSQTTFWCMFLHHWSLKISITYRTIQINK